jgi:hypothetical protein
VANFGVMHLVGNGADVAALVEKHVAPKMQVMNELWADTAPPVAQVFPGVGAVLALRKPGYSPERARATDKAFRDAALAAGFVGVDSLVLSTPRPDETNDGMHFGGATVRVQLMQAMNAICNG